MEVKPLIVAVIYGKIEIVKYIVETMAIDIQYESSLIVSYNGVEEAMNSMFDDFQIE